MHTQQGSYDQTFYAFYRITYKVYFARQICFLAKKVSAISQITLLLRYKSTIITNYWYNANYPVLEYLKRKIVPMAYLLSA